MNKPINAVTLMQEIIYDVTGGRVDRDTAERMLWSCISYPFDYGFDYGYVKLRKEFEWFMMNGS